MGFKSTRNPYNTLFKKQVVSALYHDIYIFPETHCLNDEKIDFDSYAIYQNNRVPHSNAKKGSGGIAIAVHSSVLSCHTMLSVLYGVDGQIAIKLKCNSTEMTLGIVGLYLSPDSYRYGQEAEEFFNQASVLWQDLQDCDLLIGGGDINARTKDMVDFIPDIDGQIIPIRNNPDSSKNAHADSFITFLKDNRSIILNGRVTPEYNDYTFVSTRGCSVPDYIFCPVENLYNCTSMKTLLVSDVISDFKMLPPQSIPDHSILSSKFVTSFYYVEKNFEDTSTFQASNNDMQHNSLKPRKKNLSKINEGYMMNEETTELVQQAITRLEQKVESKKEIDLKWAEVKNILLTELKK